MQLNKIHELYQKGAKIREIAHELGMNENSVRTKIHRARKVNPENWPYRRSLRLQTIFTLYDCTYCAILFAIEDYEKIDVLCPNCNDKNSVEVKGKCNFNILKR